MDCHVSKIPQLLPADANAVFVITGANRGIGLEQVRQFIEKTKAHIICTVRKTSNVDHLKSFAQQGHSKQFTIVEMDTSDESSIQVCSRSLDVIGESATPNTRKRNYNLVHAGSCRASQQSAPSRD